jgi:hypothetical protein
MNKNRIGGIRRRASWQLTTKPISIKGAGCKSGGGALKAVELTSGDLLPVAEWRLREERPEEAAEVSRAHSIPSSREKARTVLREEVKESG